MRVKNREKCVKICSRIWKFSDDEESTNQAYADTMKNLTWIYFTVPSDGKDVFK